MKNSLVRSSLMVVGLLVSMGWMTQTFAQTQQGVDYKYYFDAYGIEVLNAPGVEITYPTRAKPNPEQNITDLSYWVNEVLPYAQDRNASKYIVYPKHGIVVPVLTPNANDQVLIDQGEMFDHYPYLEKGALHYFGYDPHKGYGNMVIAGHSSFNKSALGNYKTTFQALPISKPGEKIFIYIKNAKGSYDFFEYTITKSFRTHKYDVGIMQHTPDNFTLTTYGCYVIGSNEERRVNVATMSTKVLAHSNLNVQRTHASAGVEQPGSIVNDTSITVTQSPSTNSITQQILARSMSYAYTDMPTLDTSRMSIAQRIAARLQVRDAQEAVSVTSTTKSVEYTSAQETAPTQEPTYSAAELVAMLLRPKMSLQQELTISARARALAGSRSPQQISEFVARLEAKKEQLKGATDTKSLRKEVVIAYLLEQLTGK